MNGFLKLLVLIIVGALAGPIGGIVVDSFGFTLAMWQGWVVYSPFMLLSVVSGAVMATVMPLK